MPTRDETVTVEIDRPTAEALLARATAKGLSLGAYLRGLAGPQPPAAHGGMTLAEFDGWLDELSGNPSPAPSLPADFSRRDIYADHD